MARKKRVAIAFKDNFWSKQRVEKNMAIDEIADLLHLSKSAVGQYFTGASMPSDDIIRDLCELFDVDPIEGAREFRKAHQIWDADRTRKLVYSGKVPYQPKRHYKKREKPTTVTNVEGALKMLYGVLSCEEFITIYNYVLGNTDKPVSLGELLYHKIDDYQEYMKIISLLEGTNGNQ